MTSFVCIERTACIDCRPVAESCRLPAGEAVTAGHIPVAARLE